MSKSKSRWLSGERIAPGPLTAGMSASALIDQSFLAYNAGRLKTAGREFFSRFGGTSFSWPTLAPLSLVLKPGRCQTVRPVMIM